MNIAGSKEWTCIEERPRTLLLVVELAESDRYRWRDVDADLRKLLRDQMMEDLCYVRYYLERPKSVSIEAPETTRVSRRSQRIQEQNPPSTRRERNAAPATPDSLPELVPMPGSSIPRLRTPAPPLRQESRVGRRLGATPEQRESALRSRNDSQTAQEDISQAISDFVSGRPEVRAEPPPPPTRLPRTAQSTQTPLPLPARRPLPRPLRRIRNVWSPTPEDVQRMNAFSQAANVAETRAQDLVRRLPAPALPPGLPVPEHWTEHQRLRAPRRRNTTDDQSRNISSLAQLILREEGDDEYGWPY